MNRSIVKFSNKYMVRGLILVVTALAFSLSIAANSTSEYAPGEVVIKLKRVQDLFITAKRYGLSPSPIDRFGTRPIYRMRIIGNRDPQAVAEQLEADPFGRVEFAEPNFFVESPEARGNPWSIGGGQPQYVNAWYRPLLRIDSAHTASMGQGIKVAVLDTGVDLDHPILVNRIGPGYDFVNDDAVPDEEGIYAVNGGYGHGTHVAGLVLLVAPQSTLMPVRVLDPNGVGNIWVLAEGLLYAADPDGDPNTDDGADVINLSLSTRRQTDLLRSIVEEIGCAEKDDLAADGEEKLLCKRPGQKGIVVVAGAGNSGSSNLEFPAGESLQSLISVAATNKTDVLAPFSTFGGWVSIAAPGEAILSTVPGGGFGTWSGTSMSTPLVAGSAALIRAQNTDWTSYQVKERIVSSSVQINGQQSPNRRLDVAACVGE